MGKLIITGCLTFFPQYIMFNPLYTENRIIGTLAKIMLPNIERRTERWTDRHCKTASHLPSGWQTVVDRTYYFNFAQQGITPNLV